VAGAVIAMACYLILTLLFAAIGVTLTESNVRDNAVAAGVIVALVCSLIFSLFLGGWVAAQLTAGENQREAVIYGLLTWAVYMGIVLWFVGIGVRTGYFAAVGGAVVAQRTEGTPTWEESARRAGVPQQRIDELKAGLDPNRVRERANDPQAQEIAREAAMATAWLALVGTMLSMAAAVSGALVGCGPTFRLFRVAAVRREPDGPRLIIPTA
jgi:Kef-type K+ transport system membrane component KefB